jgi:hypothetical protein
MTNVNEIEKGRIRIQEEVRAEMEAKMKAEKAEMEAKMAEQMKIQQEMMQKQLEEQMKNQQQMMMQQMQQFQMMMQQGSTAPMMAKSGMKMPTKQNDDDDNEVVLSMEGVQSQDQLALINNTKRMNSELRYEHEK